MSARAQILEAIDGIGWGTCVEIVEVIDDSDLTVKNVSAHLSGLLADGRLQSRKNAQGRVEYAIVKPAQRTQPMADIAPAPIAQPQAIAAEVEVEAPPAPPAVPVPLAPETIQPRRKIPANRQIIGALTAATEPLFFRELCARAEAKSGAINKALQQLRADGFVVSDGRGNRSTWWLAGRTFDAAPQAASAPKTAKALAAMPPFPKSDIACPVKLSDPDETQIPPVPAARKAADELHDILDLVRNPCGLLDRAEAVATDIEDLIADACDQELDHATIKALTTANGAMQRVARRLARGAE